MFDQSLPLKHLSNLIIEHRNILAYYEYLEITSRTIQEI